MFGVHAPPRAPDGENTMSSFLDAIVVSGPNVGFTVRQCIAYGLATNVDDDMAAKRAEAVKSTMSSEERDNLQRQIKALEDLRDETSQTLEI